MSYDLHLECRTCKCMLFGSVNLEDHAFHDLWTIEDEPKPFESQARKAQKREMAAWSKASRYDDMMNALTKAINNQGRNPKYHRETMARHRNYRLYLHNQLRLGFRPYEP